MKTVLIVVFGLVLASAVPVEKKKATEYEEGVGGYNFGYATSNGIYVEEAGELQNVDKWDEGIAVQGKYQFTAPNGEFYSIEYVADNNGFRPKMKFKKAP